MLYLLPVIVLSSFSTAIRGLSNKFLHLFNRKDRKVHAKDAKKTDSSGLCDLCG